MKIKRQIGILFGLAMLIVSCGPARFVEPLKKNENAIGIDLGGPLVDVPGAIVMPIPFSSINYGRGITDDLTLHGTWFTTAAIFGDVQLEIGGTYGMWESKNKKHGISGMLGFNTAMDVFENNFKFWPRLDAHYFYRYNHRKMQQEDLLTGGVPKANMVYFGLSSWYELSGTKSHGEPQNHWVVPALDIGHDLNWGQWTFKAEIKVIAPYVSNRNLVVDYKSIAGKVGATGIYFGLIRKF